MKDTINTLVIPESDMAESAYIFNGENNVEILRIMGDGCLFVHGEKAKTEKEVVDALLEFTTLQLKNNLLFK